MIIKGGVIVNYDVSFQGDIRIENGIITELESKLTARTGEQVVMADNCRVMPGGIDKCYKYH